MQGQGRAGEKTIVRARVSEGREGWLLLLGL